MTRYYISDLHFNHWNINRIDGRGFESVEQMNEYMIYQWNNKVKPEDEVIILGDLTLTKNGKEVNELVKKLNGKKHLIIGNHDHFIKSKNFNPSLFKSIEYYKEFEENGRNIVCCHYPIVCYNHQFEENTYMLYGHIHNSKDVPYIDEYRKIVEADDKRVSYIEDGIQKRMAPPFNMINCFCKRSDYIPLTLDEWIKKEEERWNKVSGC